ncbi:TorF family putative porin [Ottowia sp.]|uniref:TorF family putative porin n=1 Tax=Ottowia sp. TaxID=1898956 RepID=UPI003A8C35EB
MFFGVRTMMFSVLTAALAGAGGAAWAQDAAAATVAEPTSAHSIAFNVAVTSDYRFRGISQSRRKPAISGGADYSHTSGLYVGTWLSSIKWTKDAGGDGHVEWDIYGGYKGVAGPLNYDVGVLRYQYPDNALAVSANTTEIYGALSYSLFTAKYSHSVTNLFGFADSKHSGYLDLSATIDLGQGWSVVPHVGRQWVRHNSDFSYTDYAVTLNKDFGNGLVASAALIGTDADKQLYVTPSGKFTGKHMLVAGLKYSF